MASNLLVSLTQCFTFSGSALLCQNLKFKALPSSIFSTSSMGSPLVSGTKMMTKMIAAMVMKMKIMKVHEVPMACVRVRKDCATMRFETQFEVEAMPPQMPLYLRG